MVAQNTEIRLTLPPGKFSCGFLFLLSLILSSVAWSATDCSQVTQIPQIECEALLDLYNSTDGPNWMNNGGWNETNAPCSWYGVFCDGHITELQLEGNHLNGTIPESLGNLSQLRTLILYGNPLHDTIPESLGNLSQLYSLVLSMCKLSGTIPESLGNLNQLNFLNLNINQLSGPIPESLGNLNQLRYLGLTSNQLCGEIPNTLILLGQIKNCLLDNNHLTVNPNSSGLINYLNQNCPIWKIQGPPITNCTTDQHYTLALQTTGEGTVTAPTGLNDSIQCPTNCNEDYLEDTNLTLTAQAADNFLFTQWGGNCTGTDPLLTLTITDNLTCTATFEPQPPQPEFHHFSLTPSGDGQGTISFQINQDPAINCQPDCTDDLPHQSEITLTAQADESSRFVGWFGDGCTSHFVITQDIICSAKFELRPQYALTVISQGTGSGSINSADGQIACGNSCSHAYLSDTTVTLTAAPNSGSSFLGWSGDCHSSTQTATVAINRHLTCTASFSTVGTSGSSGTPQLQVEPVDITFATTNTLSKHTVTLTNPGNASLYLGKLTLDDPTAFQLSKDTCSNQWLVPNGICTVILAFEPPTAAEYQTQLWIPANAPNTSTSVALQGSGCSDPTHYQSNVVFQPYRLDFGIEPVGHTTTRQQRVDMWSQGCGTVDIDTIKLTGRYAEEFNITQRDCYYGGWQDYNYASCTLTVAFNPTSAGVKSAQPVITYTDPTLQASPYRWNARAVSEGTAQLQLSEMQHDFGTITLGQELPPSWQLTLTNTGNVNLEWDQISITDDFKYYDYGCTRLLPRQSCQLIVSVLPTTTLGDKSGQLTLSYEGTLTSIPLWATITGPANCSPEQVTIETTGQAALWNQPDTWQRLNSSTEELPTVNDVVRINSSHVVVGAPLIQVKALCIEPNAVLVSQDDQGTALAIQATDYFQNFGHVLGLDGQSSTSDTCTQPELIGTPGCAMPGASVIIQVGSQFSHYNKRDDWWWEGNGGPILNSGYIKGGLGGNGRYYAAAGGDALVLGRNTTNQIRIQAGDGGNLTGTQAGQAGRGGVTQIWGKLGGPGHLYNQNGAQALAGNGGHCHPQATAAQGGGHGGNLWLVSLPNVHLDNGIYRAGQGGNNCQFATGDGDVIIEPGLIDVSGAQTRINGGNISIFGGPNWILDLRNTTEQILEATGDITFATGEGGIIDLRGNHTTLIQAQGQVNLFADTILLDEGITLTDLIAANQIVVGPAKLLRDVSLAAPRQVFGQPQTHLTLNFTLANNGPQTETYMLTLDDPEQWSLPLPSSTLTVAELTRVTITVPVSLPAISDVTNTVTLTATSQADPSVTASAPVTITVTTQPPLIELATLNAFLASQQLPTVSSLLAAEPTVVIDESPAPENDPAVTEAVEAIESSVEIENTQSTFTAIPTDEIEPLIADNPQLTTANQPSETETETNLSETRNEALTNSSDQMVTMPNDDSINSFSAVDPTIVTVVEPNVICPLNTNWIDWPCHNEGQTLQDVTLGSNASVNGGAVAGIIDNHGWLSQIEVASGANVTGGYFTGKIRNHGTLTDIQFVGQELSGGTLAGIINNNSLIGGTLSDIVLAAGTTLSGGAVSGHINGHCDHPARLEHVLIKSSSDLSCLILGEGIQLSDNVKFEAVQVVASPPATLSEPVEVLLPALETAVFDKVAQSHPTSALVAGGISVNDQVFQSIATVTPTDWVTVTSQIETDPAHWQQPAEIIVYGRYQAVSLAPVEFMLVKDPVTGQSQVQSWNGELAQLVAFETVTALTEQLWLPIYEDFLKLATGRLELFCGYRVVNGVEEGWLIQNRHGIDIEIVAD